MMSIPLDKCHWWMDKTGAIHMSVPNDAAGNFITMFDGEKFYPNAYPKHVWERWGWECLGLVEEQTEQNKS
jgi:hypothetical protein